MRVLLVSDFYPPVAGGAEFHVDALASELVHRGHEVAVATLTPDAAPTSERVRVFAIAPGLGRVIPHVDADRPFPPPVPDPYLRRQLRQVVEDLRPDVIHAHGWLAVSLPRRPHVPLVWTAHDYGMVCERRTLLDDQARVCAGPAPGKCFSCARQQYGAVTAAALGSATAVGRQLMRADRVLAVSPAVARALHPHVPVPVDIVENFLPDVTPAADLPGWLPTKPFVLFAGDPSHHKGIDVLLDCWRLDPPPASLVVATTRPIEAVVPRDVLVGRMSRGEMAAAWSAAAVAVVPSRWADPCPTVVLEAMAAGTPVVGTSLGGIPHLVRDGVDGVLVEPGNSAALRAALTALLDDATVRDRLGASAALRAQGFRAAAVVPRIEQAYRSAISGPGGEVA